MKKKRGKKRRRKLRKLKHAKRENERNITHFFYYKLEKLNYRTTKSQQTRPRKIMPSTIPRVTASSISCSSAVTIKRQPPNPSRPNLTRLVACVSSKEEKEVAHCVVWKKKKKKKTTNYEALFVSSLVVDEKYRRQGIASKLLEEVELLARESEVDNVELTVNNWNANALSLYEKRGFRMLKEEGEDFKEKIMQFAEDPLRMVQKRMVMVVK